MDSTQYVKKKKTRVSCQYHSRNIAKIKKLSEDTFKTLVNVFISSKLDNCHSLLYGLSKHTLRSRGDSHIKRGGMLVGNFKLNP